MECYLCHPALPRPVLRTRSGESQTVGVRLHLNAATPQFGVVRDATKTLVEELHPLPPLPKGCPPWKYAISLPAKADKDNAIIFLNGKFRWVWLTDARTQIPWKTSAQPLSPEMLRASIATNREPHRLFLEENMQIAESWETGEKKPRREDPWPPLMRLRWLEILMQTHVSGEPINGPDGTYPRDGILQLKIQRPEGELAQTVGGARKAAAVSLAAFAPQEIPLALKAIEESLQEDQCIQETLSALERAATWGRAEK